MKDEKYRTALKHIMRAAGVINHEPDETKDRERLVRDITRYAPGITGRALSRMFTDAARAWERGNNSRSNEGMEAGQAKSDSIQGVAERIIKTVSPVPVEIDYPGLYPSFYIERGSSGKDSGHFYDCESLCRAIAEHLKGGTKE